jgi:hypothetical protein
MKIQLKVLIFIFCLVSIDGLHAQPRNFGEPIIPLQPDKSPIFGFDTFINDQPLQNQRNIAICSAFNGWLYAAYPYFDSNAHQDAVTMLRSKDNGVSWSVLLDGTISMFHSGIIKLDILACGHDTTNLKVFAGYCIYDTATMEQGLFVVRYDRNGVIENEFLHENSTYIRDFALASDDLYPASNSNPFSFAVVYSKGTFYNDSIVFCSSSNGGMSFDRQYKIASSSHYLHKVTLAYGRSPSCNSGRYFAAWEEQDNVNSVSGHIYTAHSEPDFNSPFTTPVLLDSLDASMANKTSNPVIACQNNAADNDSSNLTEVVLFEKYVPTTHKFNIAGLYNKKATVSGNFQKFTIDASANNKLQPDISFNAFDSTFMVTYFDSTAQKLPYYIHDFNMTDPDTWVELSAGYNDDNNLVAPHPQVVMDFGKQIGANAWIGQRGSGNGAAMFDSPFTYYTGVPGKNDDKMKLAVKIYPNPAADYTILEFELPQAENVEIKLINTMGQSLASFTELSCTSGKHQVKVDLTKYAAGMYILTIHAGDFFFSGKISVTR